MTTVDVAGARSVLKSLAAAAADIKIAHSIFALPFAILAAFLAWPRDRVAPADFVARLALIVLCMIFARTWAMLVNRIADARIDAANPRTARRAIPAGRLTRAHAIALLTASGALFVGAASLFWPLFDNPWPAYLCIPVLAWIALYSFTKRFTALCHVFLGGALAASPVAAAIAVDAMGAFLTPLDAPVAAGPNATFESFELGGIAILFLAAMVVLWVAGFDVIYALADIHFDRAHNIHSIPAHLGWRGAAWVSRALHLGAFIMLVLAWRADPRLGSIFGAGVAIVGLVLLAEHVVLARRREAGLDMAFFTLNGAVSCVLGLAGVIDLLA
jgi:4-hydroxybenzoate polyprenyltransferase